MNQQALINKINTLLPEAKAVSTQDFYGQGNANQGKGIWLKGSESYASDGHKVFNNNAPVGETLHPIIAKLIKKSDWDAQPYDAGTCMLWQ